MASGARVRLHIYPAIEYSIRISQSSMLKGRGYRSRVVSQSSTGARPLMPHAHTVGSAAKPCVCNSERVESRALPSMCAPGKASPAQRCQQVGARCSSVASQSTIFAPDRRGRTRSAATRDSLAAWLRRTRTDIVARVAKAPGEVASRTCRYDHPRNARPGRPSRRCEARRSPSAWLSRCAEILK
jgi:hypothetical protein